MQKALTIALLFGVFQPSEADQNNLRVLESMQQTHQLGQTTSNSSHKHKKHQLASVEAFSDAGQSQTLRSLGGAGAPRRSRRQGKAGLAPNYLSSFSVLRSFTSGELLKGNPSASIESEPLAINPDCLQYLNNNSNPQGQPQAMNPVTNGQTPPVTNDQVPAGGAAPTTPTTNEATTTADPKTAADPTAKDDPTKTAGGDASKDPKADTPKKEEADKGGKTEGKTEEKPNDKTKKAPGDKVDKPKEKKKEPEQKEDKSGGKKAQVFEDDDEEDEEESEDSTVEDPTEVESSDDAHVTAQVKKHGVHHKVKDNLSQVKKDSELKKLHSQTLPQTQEKLARKELAQSDRAASTMPPGVMSFTDEDLNWAFHFFRTADANQDLLVSEQDLVNNINGTPDQKQKLALFFKGIDQNRNGHVDFSEWIKWGARDGNQMLSDIKQEEGIDPASMMDPNAKIPCGEEKLRIIEAEMRARGEFDNCRKQEDGCQCVCGSEQGQDTLAGYGSQNFGGPSGVPADPFAPQNQPPQGLGGPSQGGALGTGPLPGQGLGSGPTDLGALNQLGGTTGLGAKKPRNPVSKEFNF